MEDASRVARQPSNLAMWLGDDGFGARNFRFAGAAILLDDLAEVVDIVKVEAVEAGGIRIDVARHAEIDDKDGAASAAGERVIEHSRVSTRPAVPTEVTMISGAAKNLFE